MLKNKAQSAWLEVYICLGMGWGGVACLLVREDGDVKYEDTSNKIFEKEKKRWRSSPVPPPPPAPAYATDSLYGIISSSPIFSRQ